ncbi:MAG TPA: DUF6519 domain-containing protein, partial [Iamia sp.]|nr:DUF6519 domain-containing protein [Iamia sp.]
QPGCRVIEIVPAAADAVRVGDLVELVDDEVAFSDRPQPIRRVIDRSAHALLLDRPVPVGVGHSAATHPFLRRWDQRQRDEELVDGAVPLVAGRWSPLDPGIEVEFAPGQYQRGDYWWVASRAALDGIDWPVVDGHPALLPPAGVGRRWAPLASVSIDDERGIEVRDLRTRLTPVSSSGAGAPPAGSRARAPVTPATPAVAPVGDRPVGVGEHEREVGDPATPADEDGDPGEPPPPVEPVPVDPVDPAGRPRDLRVAGTRVAWAPRQELDTEGLGEVSGVVRAGAELLVVTERGVVEVDPATGEWEIIGLSPTERIEQSCCLVDGVILLVGGREPRGRPDGAVHAFDVASRSWSRRAPLPTPVSYPCVAASQGTVHVLGGLSSGLGPMTRVTRHHQVYDAATDIWWTGSPLPRPSARAAGGVLDDGVHVVGGLGRWWFGRRPDDRHDVWSEGRWQRAEPLRRPHAHLGAAVVDGLLAVVGSGGDTSSVVVTFAPRADRWETLPPLPGPAAAPVVTGDESGLVVVGRSEEGPFVDRIASPHAWEIVVRVPGQTVFSPPTVANPNAVRESGGRGDKRLADPLQNG